MDWTVVVYCHDDRLIEYDSIDTLSPVPSYLPPPFTTLSNVPSLPSVSHHFTSHRIRRSPLPRLLHPLRLYWQTKRQRPQRCPQRITLTTVCSTTVPTTSTPSSSGSNVSKSLPSGRTWVGRRVTPRRGCLSVAAFAAAAESMLFACRKAEKLCTNALFPISPRLPFSLLPLRPPLPPIHPSTLTVEESDLDALKHLTEIAVKYDENDPREFDIAFSFAENPYFSDATITKSFKVPEEIKKEHPYAMEVPTVSPAVTIS